MNMLRFFSDAIQTPTGEMAIITDERGALRALEWRDLDSRTAGLFQRHYRGEKLDVVSGQAPAHIRAAIDDYFSGNVSALVGLPTAAAGTPFQRSVWAALKTIPVGQTRSYAQIAAMIDNPKGVRAVGLANGANPIGIVVPCHRVIGANGSMTGYGGGLARKVWLLQHEGALSKELAFS